MMPSALAVLSSRAYRLDYKKNPSVTSSSYVAPVVSTVHLPMMSAYVTSNGAVLGGIPLPDPLVFTDRAIICGMLSC